MHAHAHAHVHTYMHICTLHRHSTCTCTCTCHMHMHMCMLMHMCMCMCMCICACACACAYVHVHVHMCLGCEGPSIAEPCSVRVVWRVVRNHPYLSIAIQLPGGGGSRLRNGKPFHLLPPIDQHLPGIVSTSVGRIAIVSIALHILPQGAWCLEGTLELLLTSARPLALTVSARAT